MVRIMKKLKKKNEINNNIPTEIRVEFGKFFVFSVVLFIILGGIYPFLIVKYCSIYTQIGILVFSFLFYGYMFINLMKKRKNFMSMFIPISLIIFILIVVLDFIKLLDI